MKRGSPSGWPVAGAGTADWRTTSRAIPTTWACSSASSSARSRCSEATSPSQTSSRRSVGDGAAALVGVGAERARTLAIQGPRIVATQSRFYPNTERVMGWDVYRLPDRPRCVRPRRGQGQHPTRCRPVLGPAGSGSGGHRDMDRPSGGPKVLTAFEESLDLPADARTHMDFS